MTKSVKPRTEYTEKDKEYITKVITIMTANMKKYLHMLKERAGNISFREISRRTGISIAVLSDLEGNKYLPKMEVLLKLAYGMNSDFSTMLSYMWNSDKKSDTTIKDDANNSLDNVILLTEEPFNLEERYITGYIMDNQTAIISALEKEGLSKKDVKEVLDFVEFKKSQKKRR